MEKLSDFKPLKKLVLPGIGPLPCSGLTVIVGPNSSGKTQLLRDIRERISGEPRDLVVAEEIEIETPEHDVFLKCLKAEGYVSAFWADNDEEQFVSRTTSVGTGQGTPNVGTVQLQQWREKSKQPAKGKRRNDYLSWFSKFLVTVLFLENRLTALKPVPTIDFEKHAPGNDLHALHLNDAARAALTVEVQRAFSKAIWSCAAKGSLLCLRIADDGGVPSAEDRHSILKMAKYRTIESEGDGMKSYVYTAISLLLGRRPITIVDEPELCLHPPQAFNLGQFIGSNATSEQTTTLVATHSSHVLRGVIQTAESLQIVRLTRQNGRFAAKRVESAVLREAMKKPTVRAETVLDGIFAQAVAIVEADGDRIVYQSAWESVGSGRNFDIHFATAGGTGAIADTAQLYAILGIPVAVIADLDVLTDVPKIERILNVLCHDGVKRSNLVDSARDLAEALSKMPPTKSEDETKEILLGISSRDLKWENGDDARVRSELSELRSSLNGMRRLKSGGINGLPEELKADAADLVAKLSKHGITLVPVGELEEWLSDCDIKASKKKKWAWANEAADFIRNNGKRTDDIWEFVENVGTYLTKQFEETAQPEPQDSLSPDEGNGVGSESSLGGDGEVGETVD